MKRQKSQDSSMASIMISKKWWSYMTMRLWKVFSIKQLKWRQESKGGKTSKDTSHGTPPTKRRMKRKRLTKLSTLNLHIFLLKILNLLLLKIIKLLLLILRLMLLHLLHQNPKFRKRQVASNVLNAWIMDIKLIIVQTKG